LRCEFPATSGCPEIEEAASFVEELTDITTS
jgi:hypothetical protein